MKAVVTTQSLDDLTKFFSELPGKNERARNSALSSIGYKLKMYAKANLDGMSFNWPEISTLTKMTKAYPSNLNPATRQKASYIAASNIQVISDSSRRKAWGSLANLLIYNLDKETGVLLFGFEAGTYGTKKGYKGQRVANVIGEKVISLCRKLTEGFEHTILTHEQQRYFAVLGFIFPIGKTLVSKPRPLVGPTAIANQSNIPIWFREKFWEKLRQYVG